AGCGARGRAGRGTGRDRPRRADDRDARQRGCRPGAPGRGQRGGRGHCDEAGHELPEGSARVARGAGRRGGGPAVARPGRGVPWWPLPGEPRAGGAGVRDAGADVTGAEHRPDGLRHVRAMWADDRASAGLGIECVDVAHDGRLGTATARMTVTAEMVNGHDICTGGFIFTLADPAFDLAFNAGGPQTAEGPRDNTYLTTTLLGITI